jgi:hypothetical protein
MAFLSAALPYVAAASTAIGVAQQIKAGNEQRNQLELQAREREEDAVAAQADAQREALIEKKKARNLMSRARAVAGASGASVSDPTVTNAIADIDTQGEVNFLNALYSGNTVARGLRSGAATARRMGRAAQTASRINAASTGLGGATSWYAKYGGDLYDPVDYVTVDAQRI